MEGESLDPRSNASTTYKNVWFPVRRPHLGVESMEGPRGSVTEVVSLGLSSAVCNCETLAIAVSIQAHDRECEGRSSHGLEVSRVVQSQMTGGNRSLGIDSLVDLD